jgi:hypothetical protein
VAGGGSSHDTVSTLTLEVAQLLGAGYLGTLMMGTYMLMRTSRQLDPVPEVIIEHNSCCNHPAKDTQANAAPNSQGRARIWRGTRAFAGSRQSQHNESKLSDESHNERNQTGYEEHLCHSVPTISWLYSRIKSWS